MALKNNTGLKQTQGIKPYLFPFFLFAAFVILIVLPLFQKGTFIDGELYKTVAFNYAINTASFWSMKYTTTCMPFFCEQPPLYPFLLGGFYKIFGSHYLFDRVFTLLLLIAFIALMRKIISQLFATPGFYNSLFLFLMVSVPVWCWSYVNQVIEPLVCVVTAIGILCFLNYIKDKKIIYLLGFAATLYLSFLSKGFQSCFLVVLPVIYALLTRLSKRAVVLSVVSGIILVGGLFITTKVYQPAMDWFNCYYHARLVLTMQNVGNTTDYHAEIIIRFFTELIVPFVFIISLLAYVKLKKNYPLKFIFKNFASNTLAVAFLITALAGSFPYALSLVQRGFYLVPSFICFLLAVLIGFKRYWLFLFAGVVRLGNYAAVRIACVILFAGSIIYFCIAVNTYKRDEPLLSDLQKITPYLLEKQTVSIEDDLWNYFNLHSYLYRQKQISLQSNTEHLFLIRNKSSQLADSNYVKIDLSTEQLDLFFRK